MNMKLKSNLILLTAFLVMAIPLILTGNVMAETAGCVTSACHGDTTLVKTITVSGGTETVPLYVNITAYNATTHGTQVVECTACHTDITLSDGTHAGVTKTYGGWARFSKSVSGLLGLPGEEAVVTGAELTRNYFSPAVAASCLTCHTGMPAANAHSSAYKLVYAKTEQLTGCTKNGVPGQTITLGEDYAQGDCNRCHAACQTCHFKSDITRKNANPLVYVWDQVQTNNTTGSGATATATLTGDAVSGVNVTAGGTYYISAPTVSFSGGGGSGATATATVVSGAVSGVNVTAGGSGYTSAPTVSFTSVAPPDGMSEYQMDWTTNVASHDFNNKTYFASDIYNAMGSTELPYTITTKGGVCEACHTGMYKNAAEAYYEEDGQCKTLRATNGRRHMQTYELWISGNKDNAIIAGLNTLTAGTNTAHANMECANCHGTAVLESYAGTGNVHSLPAVYPYPFVSPYVVHPEDWYDWRVSGDVQCTDCHDSVTSHTTPEVALHIDATGTKVACTGCHTFGLARDFEIKKYGAPQVVNGVTSADVFIDPKTGEVRPVIDKHNSADAWYSHNWQKPAPGVASCANKCHYTGNVVGATMPVAHPTGPGTPSACTSCHTTAVSPMADLQTACGQCHGGSAGPGAVVGSAPYISDTNLVPYAQAMHGGEVTSGPVSPDPVLDPSQCTGTPTAAGTLASAGVAGVEVTLTDSSTGDDLYINWGDGSPMVTPTSTPTASHINVANTHTYSKPGRYQVVQTVKNACGYKSQNVSIINISGADDIGKGTLRITSSGDAFTYTYRVYDAAGTIAITNGKLAVATTKDITLDSGASYDVSILYPNGVAVGSAAGTCEITTGMKCYVNSDCPMDYTLAIPAHETCTIVGATTPTCSWVCPDGTPNGAAGCTGISVTTGGLATMTGTCTNN